MYLKNILSKKVTPQSEPIPGSNQIANNAGGYAFPVDDWTRLQRFLILGTEAGTYYVSEQKLSRDNAEAVERCIKADGQRAVTEIVEISVAGRAPKVSPCIFALALASAAQDVETRKLALAALPKVCRTASHLFEFCEYVSGFRGWGRGLREAVAEWYQGKSIADLAYQVIKYQQREGWSNADLLRLTHPKAADSVRNQLYKYVVDQEIPESIDWALNIVQGAEVIKKAESAAQAAAVVNDYRLPREAVPTQWLRTPEVQRVLAVTMPMTARIRNLGNLSKYGILAETGDAYNSETVDMIGALTDRRRLASARIHPMAIFQALKTYGQGHGVRSNASWPVIKGIMDALEKAFYLTFDNIRPTGKRILIAIDVSGSMSSPVNGMVNISCSEAAVAMALPLLMVEPKATLVTFDTDCRLQAWDRKDTLASLARKIEEGPHGGTDCSQPMIWSQANKAEFDCIIVLTDHETWAGRIHPWQTLLEYRRRMGIPVKFVGMAMAANDVTTGGGGWGGGAKAGVDGRPAAHDEDANVLDLVGLDTSSINIAMDFIGYAEPAATEPVEVEEVVEDTTD